MLATCFAGLSSAAQITCSTLASDPAALRIETLSAGSFEDAITIVPQQSDRLHVSSVVLLRGSCAGLVAGHNMPYVYFSDGWAAVWGPRLRRPNDGRPDRWELIDTQFATYPLNGFVEAGGVGERPAWDAGEFVGAYHGGASSWHLGVWRLPGQSVVASYSRAPDGTFSTPQILLSSRFPIRSATFWGVIDGMAISHGYPSAGLGITVETGDGVLAYGLSGLGLAGLSVQRDHP